MRTLVATFALCFLSGFQSNAQTYSAKEVHDFIQDISTGWTHTPARVAKIETRKEIYFYDQTGKCSAAFFAAVKDINAVFGYEKIVGTLSTSRNVEKERVGVFLLPYNDARRVLRENGAPNASFKRNWEVRVWYDNSLEINRALVLLPVDRLTETTLPFYLRRAILCAIGFPGWSSSVAESIFYSGAPGRKTAPASASFLCPLDRAVIQFCDRNVAADFSKRDVTSAFVSDWTQFVSTYKN